jgi:cellulose synthase/poly-beta-1,6-N-acetylglucosamine synthase-like glycosyltransferase
MMALHITFWVAALVLGYTYVGYPLLIRVWARLHGRPHERKAMKPLVSLMVVAHNEAPRILRRIENLLELDYEADRLEIVIASDGSSDATVALANTFRTAGVRVEAFDAHRGKPAVLNDVVPHLRGEIVVLMDVRQSIAKNAIRVLVENFADAGVGAVSGELVLTGGEDPRDANVGVIKGSMDGVGFYWRYEKFIRLSESRVDSTVGVTGALYAIRRELFEPIPADTILDDVLIPMQIVRRGFRVLFESSARASEPLSDNPGMEFRRKVRTIAGNFQLLVQHPWLLNPFANRLWLQTVSHKLFRLLCPVCLVLVLIANLMLLEFLFYQVTLLLQVLFYTAALIAHLAPQLSRKSPLLSVPHAFCLLNWSTVAGFIRFISGRQQVTWTRLREPEPH